jgi:hypothetical protein
MMAIKTQVGLIYYVNEIIIIIISQIKVGSL